ncbi:MAG: PGRS repeat-containing protein, partial [Mycolicibacter sinensis]
MAQHPSKRPGKSHQIQMRRRRAAGLGATASAFLAFGLTPLASAPTASADFFGWDWLVDLFEPSAATSAVDPTGDSGWDAFALPGVAAAGDPNSVAAAFQTDFYLPLHAALEAYINSPLGEAINPVINQLFAPLILPGFCGLICDGADGTMANPDGQGGGLFFGDAGDGYDASNDPGMAGGNGGVAGGIGDGGDGGAGGLGADGGNGGAGGEWMG